ncbi:hypothetical protein NP493_893g00003 [Ridgeia piscesae]|uniref:Uncharacterized protein n=1 Tax=Ridgeia piscesae TaxID=27915 RepID=A0AAD9KM23_RIDPI|nr:hypothetical protein NP493_893g00003 [Ridgeia piscesae]
MAIVYTSLQLHQLCRQSAKAFKRVTKAVYDDLNALGISYARSTHRGTSGGRKQCQVTIAISVKVTPGRTALSTPSLRNNLVQTVNRSNLISVKLQQHCTTNSLRAAVLNTRSTCELDKCQQIQHLITENQLDICSLTETWFKPSHIAVKTVVPPGYTMKHIPRANARGGDVAIIFRDSISVTVSKHNTYTSMFIQSWSRTIANRNDIQTSTKSKVDKRSSIS